MKTLFASLSLTPSTPPMALILNPLNSTPKFSLSIPTRKSPRLSTRNFSVLNNGEKPETETEITGSVTSNPSVSGSESGKKKRLSEQSSWEAKDALGNDYLYRLGAEADNTNVTVGARVGVVDDLFTGNFLGRDADIVFDYRQKVTRTFEYLQGDYYIAPLFLDKVGKLRDIPKTKFVPSAVLVAG